MLKEKERQECETNGKETAKKNVGKKRAFKENREGFNGMVEQVTTK